MFLLWASSCVYTPAEPGDAPQVLEGTFAITPQNVPSDGSSAALATAQLTSVTGSVSGLPVTIAGNDGAGHTVSKALTTDANGVASTPLTSTIAGTFTFAASVTVDDQALAFDNVQVVVFTPLPARGGVPSAALSTLTVTPTLLAADNIATAAITFNARDQLNQPLASAPVAVTVSGTNNTLGTTASSTDANGLFHTTLTSTKAEVKNIAVTLDGNTTLTSKVTFVGGGASSTKSTATLAPSKIIADAVSTGVITVTILDAYGNPVQGAGVNVLTGDLNVQFSNGAETTDASGNFRVTISSKHASNVTFAVSSGSFSSTVSATFVAGPVSAATSTLTYDTNATFADGSSSISISGNLYDQYSNVVANTAVTWSASGTNTTFSGLSSTDANGMVYTNVASTQAQNENIIATVGVVSLVIPVTFVRAPSQTQSSFTASPTSVLANGTAQTSLTVTARDASGNIIANVPVGLSAGRGASFVAPTDRTNASGVYTAGLTSTFAGVMKVTATLGSVTLSQNVTFTVPVCNGRVALAHTNPGIAAPSYPSALSVVDLTGDSRTDIVVAEYYPSAGSAYVSQGNGNFVIKSIPDFGGPISGPRALTFSDFNVDDITDMAVAYPQAANVSIMIGNGDGTFQSPLVTPTASGIYSIAAGFLNFDITGDLVVGDSTDGNITVFLGQGGGVITPLPPVQLPGPPMSLAVVDFNGDGADDVAAGLWGNANQVGISLVNGATGALGIVGLYPSSPNSVIAVGDINHDGFIDIVAYSTATTLYTVLLGKGNGTFSVKNQNVSSGLTSVASKVQLIDINGDGALDAMITFNALVATALGKGDGTFAAPTSYRAGYQSAYAAALDVNNDGYPEIAIANQFSGSVEILPNSTGTLPADTITLTGSFAEIIAHDINGDGLSDLMVASGSGGTRSLLATGGSNFATGTSYASGSGGALALGDFNHDGIQDVVSQLIGNSVNLTLLKADGTASTSKTYTVAGAGVMGIAAVDFNNDGNLDAVAQDESGNAFRVMLGDGLGSLATPNSTNANDYVHELAAADLNRDGFAEVLVLGIRTPYTVAVWSTTDGVTFTPRPSPPQTGGYPNGITATDVNNDGYPDVLVSHTSGIAVFVSTGSTGQLTLAQTLPAGDVPAQTIAADLNSDGITDILVGDGSLGVYRGLGGNQFAVPATYYTPFGQANSLTVGDFNGDGFPDVAVSDPATGALRVSLNLGCQ